MKMSRLISFLNNFVTSLQKKYIHIFSALVFIASASPSLAALPYCTDFFGTGIQAHGADNFVRFNYNAQLLNAEHKYIPTKLLLSNKWSIKSNCGITVCEKSSPSAQDMTPGTILETTSTNEVIVPLKKKITVGANNILHYGKVVVTEWSTAVFKPQTEPYVITDLVVGYKSKLQLPAGEYWVTRLTLEVEGRIDVIGEGQVTLYVTDSLWVPFNFKINENTKNAAKMAIYTFSDSNYYTGSKTFAFIRSEGEVILNHRAAIVGGVLGKFITLDTESQIVYDPAAARGIKFTNYCRAWPFPLDTTQPVFILDQYDDITTQDHIVLTGSIVDTGEHASGVGDVSVNGIPIILTNGNFSVTVPLPELGTNWLIFLIYDLAGNEIFLTYPVNRALPGEESASY